MPIVIASLDTEYSDLYRVVAVVAGLNCNSLEIR
jgi:hypothetical protein